MQMPFLPLSEDADKVIQASTVNPALAAAETAHRIVSAACELGCVQEKNSLFSINSRRVSNLSESAQSIITLSVLRANIETSGGGVQAAMPSGWQDKAMEILRENNLAKEIINDIETVLAGASTTGIKWHGVTVDFSRDSAAALCKLLDPAFQSPLIILSPIIPVVGTILPISIATSSLMIKWIEAENNDTGIMIELLLWLIPLVSGRESS